MYQKELFANYEIDDSKWKRALFTLLGGSFVFHLVILLSALFVPAVRDAFYVASLFSDAPSSWKDGAYDKTKINEDFDVNIINLPPADQLQYPEGYFALANGDALPPTAIEMTTQPAPEIVSLDNGLPTDNDFPPLPTFTPQPLPTPFPLPNLNNPLPPVNLPSSSGSLPKPPKPKKGAKMLPLPSVNDASATPTPNQAQTAQATPTPNQNQTAQAQPSPSPSASPTEDGKLNQKPLLDIANVAIKQINDKEIDLNKPFNVTIKGVLGDDGKLVEKASSFKNNGGDANLARLAADFVAAMSDSNMLTYVKGLCGNSKKCDVQFNISKDEKDIRFQLVSSSPNVDEARKTMNGLNLGFSAFKFAKQGTEEGELLDKVTFATDQNQILINWQMDTPTAMRKINNKLAEVPKLQESYNKQLGSTEQAVK